MDIAGKGEIESIDNCWFWNDGSIGIVRGGVNLVVMREGISRSKFGAWKNFPNDIKVL